MFEAKFKFMKWTFKLRSLFAYESLTELTTYGTRILKLCSILYNIILR